jgi:glycosyltransferase involved in cell wall biosynthesis
VKSVLNQVYKNIEVIVVDNGSTDDSLKKINTFSHDKRVKIIKLDKNLFPGNQIESAFGIGVKKSSGEYISILYADDWYLPNKIEKQVDLFNKSHSSVGVVYCHGYRYFEKDKTKIEFKQQSVRGYVFKDYLTEGDVVIPISPLVKRCCYEIIGLNNLWTGSEYDFFMMSQYVNFDYVDENLVVMRMHDNNDAKNTLSVYERVKLFHSIALSDSNTVLRGEGLINRRMASDFISFGLTFIVMMDMDHGREALIKAIKTYPVCIFKLKVILSLSLSFLPSMVSKYILIVFGKSPGIKSDIY